MKNLQGVQRIATEYENAGQLNGIESKQNVGYVGDEVNELRERLREAEERSNLSDRRCV
jgi:hypothetical protein